MVNGRRRNNRQWVPRNSGGGINLGNRGGFNGRSYNAPNSIGSNRANASVAGGRVSNQTPSLYTEWSRWVTIAFTCDAGIGNQAMIPVRTLTDTTALWEINAANKAAFSTKYTANVKSAYGINKNLVPIAYEFNVESISTGNTLAGACKEGGIMVGFYNRNSDLLDTATAQPTGGTLLPNYPDPRTVTWVDVGIQLGRVPIGGSKIQRVSVPHWATGWTLEDAHSNGKAFAIRWTSPTTIALNVSIRVAYERANAL